jgi:hypothetical protein
MLYSAEKLDLPVIAASVVTPGNLLTHIFVMLFEWWEDLSVMIEEIKTRRLERMMGSNSCLNLCYKNLCKLKNMAIPPIERYIYHTELYFNANN